MKLAFVAFRYFPYGGLERDMLAMARTCLKRGHDVLICVGHWEGRKPDDLNVRVVSGAKKYTNAGRNAEFIKRALPVLKQENYTLVGFNKMPLLDFYYAADTCFAAKAYGERGRLYRSTKRAKQYLAHERAVFSAQGHTHCFMISPQETAKFEQYYQTPPSRLHSMPPGINEKRVMPADYDKQREQLRQQYGILPTQRIILMVGSDFKRKGLDRALKGLAALPPAIKANTQLWVAGQDEPKPFTKLVKQLSIGQQVKFLGARDDISELMWSADMLIHLAYSEAAGLVLLEAMVAGLPVVASKVCGYAPFIEKARMGRLLSEPISADETATQMEAVLSAPRSDWVAFGRQFAETDIFSMTERAANIIESVGTAV